MYQKNDNGTMTFYEVEVGTMEYHPSHGHVHFDQWTIMTLRIPDENNMNNPLEWPVIGEGAKVGFVSWISVIVQMNLLVVEMMKLFLVWNLLSQADFPNYG